MRLFVTGDLHGTIEICRLNHYFWPEGQKLTKDDVLLVAGDFGLVFLCDKTETNWLDWLNNQPWTTLFIDGNHENFPALLSYHEDERYGGPVGTIRPSVLHLKKRGHIYSICNKRVWCFGGALSIDRHLRTIGQSWWPEEEANYREIEYAQNALENCRNVDFALTHDAPLSLLRDLYAGQYLETSRTSKFLDLADEIIDTKYWFFGHHHIDRTFNRKNRLYRALFRDIIEIPV